MKKFFFAILFLSIPLFAAPKTKLIYYYLKCTDGSQITSVALEWEKESIHIDYGISGRTDFFPWSVNFEYSLEYQTGGSALDNRITWKDGIHFIPSNLGLPDKINSCDVVPFVVDIEGLGYVGSRDDYSSLNKYNRLIFNFHFDSPARASVIFSDKFKVLPPRAKYHFIRYQVCYTCTDASNYPPFESYYTFGSSYDLKIKINGTSDTLADINSCTWWDEKTPEMCKAVIGKNRTIYLEDVEFWRNGVIKNANSKTSSSLWPKDWNNPASKQIQCSKGPIIYRSNGELESCQE